jgi:hypothetical protein
MLYPLSYERFWRGQYTGGIVRSLASIGLPWVGETARRTVLLQQNGLGKGPESPGSPEWSER